MREGANSLDIMSIHIPIKGVVIMGLAIQMRIGSDAVSGSLLYAAMAFIITMVVVDATVWLIHKVKGLVNQRPVRK